MPWDAPLAQLVEQLTLNQWVRGSSPRRCTKVSVFNAVGPPVPIPNTEVKRCSGKDTWLAPARKNSSTLTQTKETLGEDLKEVGYFNAVGPPVPIPNTEVKRCSGENTWLATAREDNS